MHNSFQHILHRATPRLVTSRSTGQSQKKQKFKMSEINEKIKNVFKAEKLFTKTKIQNRKYKAEFQQDVKEYVSKK